MKQPVVSRWLHGWRMIVAAAAVAVTTTGIGLGVASASTAPARPAPVTDAGLLTFYPQYYPSGPACALSRTSGPDTLTAAVFYDSNGNALGCTLSGFPSGTILVINTVEPAYGTGGTAAIQDAAGNGTQWQVDGTGDNSDPNVATFIAVRS